MHESACEACAQTRIQWLPVDDSEMIAKRKLQVAGEAGFRGDFSERRRRGIEKAAGASAGCKSCPVRMIVDIERLGAELQAVPFVERELLVQTEVPVLEAGTVNGVTNTFLKNECARRGRSENRLPVRIGGREVLRRTGTAVGELAQDRGSSVHIPELPLRAAAETAKFADSRVVGVVASHSARRPGLVLIHTADLPAAEHFPG
jgi:hypothetical protein